MKTTTIFQDHSVWRIENGQARVLIAPDFGARLLTWEVAGQPIIHWPETADWNQLSEVRGGNPILFPFVARHMVDGVIGRWQDAEGHVRELPMHGFARDLPFTVVEESDACSLRMRLTHTPATFAMYPFEWVFDVVYRLGKNELEVTLETRNSGSAPLPYFPGHHFYFAVPHEERSSWRLNLPCARWGWQNKDGSIRFAPATQPEWPLDDPAIIDRFHLNFTSHQVSLEGSEAGRRILIDLVGNDAAPGSSVPWYDVTTWTQSPTSDFFCVEPWLGLPNAIHHGHGLRLLPPGQTESAVCRISVRDVSVEEPGE